MIQFHSIQNSLFSTQIHSRPYIQQCFFAYDVLKKGASRIQSVGLCGLVPYHHTIIRQISVCLCFCLKFDFQENPSHGELQTRPLCCPEPEDVQYDLSFYGCGQIISWQVTLVSRVIHIEQLDWCMTVQYLEHCLGFWNVTSICNQPVS